MSFYIMNTTTLQFKVRQCFKCLRDTEYFCKSCQCNMCPRCKENHEYDLQTIDHNVILYCQKYIPTEEDYSRHLGMVKKLYCELSQHSDSSWCTKQECYTEQQNQKHKIIHSVRSEALFYTQVLLREIKADVETCHKEFSLFQSELLERAQRLRGRLDNVLRDVDFKHRCLKQKRKMYSHLSKLQRYEQRIYEYSSNKPVQFLINKTRISKIKFTPFLTLHSSQFSITDSLNLEDVMETLIVVQIAEKGVRRVENDRLLKLMCAPEIDQYFNAKGVQSCNHISCVTTDRVFVNDDDNLILTNTSGDSLYHFKGHFSHKGVHTVSSERELIYIDENWNINKLSTDMKTSTTYIKITDSAWKPQCVYWSPFSGDLLVGMYKDETKTAKVIRYNGQLIQTIQHYHTGLDLYKNPSYITENNNGDVIVCDSFKAVVVTDCRGRYRFSYAKNPSGTEFVPCGICTDALSHILLCDYYTNTVQMLDKDGQFLTHLLIRPFGIFAPHMLSYDVNTHRLWVGSEVNNRICIYRYIDRIYTLTDQSLTAAEVVKKKVGILTADMERSQERHGCLLKLMSPAKLLHSITLTDIHGCVHISHVTSDQVWVNDLDNLILKNKTGDTLHFLKNSKMFFNYAVHTVNSEGELLYKRVNEENMHTVTKLSNDMKTNTDFIVIKDSTWKILCLHWSSYSGNLLAGMANSKGTSCKIARYNQDGHLTQTIDHDNNGLEMYRDICYITENTNWDVAASEFDHSSAVVVTNREGRYRFSYTGNPPGSGIRPRGICTDALSHILVCDDKTERVHILDGDGQFLSYISTKSQDILKPHSLSYDYNTHRLWVGSTRNKIYVIQYMTDQSVLTEKHAECLAGDT